MKRIILVMSILFSLLIPTTGFADTEKDGGVLIVHRFVDKHTALESTYIGLSQSDSLDPKERAQQCDDYIKDLENLKKEILTTRKSSSETILENKVDIFNQLLDNFVDVIDVQIYFLQLGSDFLKSGKKGDDMSNEQKSKFDEMVKREEKVKKSLVNSIEEFLKEGDE